MSIKELFKYAFGTDEFPEPPQKICVDENKPSLCPCEYATRCGKYPQQEKKPQ